MRHYGRSYLENYWLAKATFSRIEIGWIHFCDIILSVTPTPVKP